MYNKQRFKPGYAITEVLIAMVIISISYLQLSRSLASVMGAAVQNISATRAINLAHSTLEEVMAHPFDAVGSEAQGYALEFNGTDEYLDCGDVTVINSADSLTISGWINPDMASGNDIIFSKDGEDADNRILLYINVSTEDLYIKYENGGMNQYGQYTSFTTAVYQNKWTHFAVVFDGGGSGNPGKLKLYLNGSAVDLSFTGIIASTITNASGQSFYIGKSGSDYFDGTIDEVRIWNVVRSAAEILGNYNSGLTSPFTESNLKLYLRMNNGEGIVAFDFSSNEKHGTLNNMDDANWVSSSSTILGKEAIFVDGIYDDDDPTDWSTYNDVDDFNGVNFTDDYYTGITGTITVEYVSVHQDTWAISTVAGPTDYKQVTVRVNIPGGDAYTQLRAIKSAKTIQHYALTYSPYGN